MKVLVTGATGFVGRAVVLALRQRNHDVVALVRTPSKARDLEAAGAVLATGDMLMPSSYQHLVAEVDTVIQAAQYATSGRLNHKKLQQIRHADEIMSMALAQACLEYDKTLVYTSGCFNYGDHGDSWITEATPANPSPLGVGHYQVAAELTRLHAERGLKVIILAPGFVYGLGGLFKQSFYDTLLKGQLRVFGKGENYWSPIHVDDLAQAYALAVESTYYGETFNIVDDAPLTLRNLVDTLTDAAGKPRVGSIPPWLIKLIIGAPVVDSLVTSFRVRNDKAKKLAWTPRYASFDKGLPTVLLALQT